jgi:hypothetical protein
MSEFLAHLPARDFPTLNRRDDVEQGTPKMLADCERVIGDYRNLHFVYCGSIYK